MSAHIIPPKTYYAVFLALMVLLVLTVVVDGGRFHTEVALTIAIAKALLIVLYFMHVRYAHPLTRIFAGVGFIWLAILIALAMGDYLTRDQFVRRSPPASDSQAEVRSR